MTRPTGSRRLLLLLAPMVLSACSDDPSSVELDYEPATTVAQLEGVIVPLLQAGNAFSGLSAAGEALGQFTAAEPAQELLRFRPALDPRTAAELGTRDRGMWSAQVTFPPEIVGRTLAWDPAQNRYVVDETRTDAPEDGVRIVHYTMSQATRTPLLPLEEIGFIDLVDEDVADEERLGIRVVITTGTEDVTLLDYVIGFSGDSQASEGNLRFRAAGALTGEAGPVDFELNQAFTWNQGENSEGLALDYRYHAPGGVEVALRMEAASAFGEQARAELDLLVAITGGGDLVEVDASVAADGSLAGEIRLNGTGVVDIAGADGGVTFTHAGGGSLTQQDRNRLRDLWSLVVGLLALTEGLLSPAGILLLPG